MKVRLEELRNVIRSVMRENDDFYEKERAAAQKLQSIRHLEGLNKPFLKGQWEKIPRNYGRENEKFSDYRYATEGDCWKAEHPELGTLFLTFTSGSSYKTTGRLRDPSGTRYSHKATIGFKPFSTSFPYAIVVFNQAAVGEHRYDESRMKASNKMFKLFGVDPYDFLKPKTPDVTAQKRDAFSKLPADQLATALKDRDFAASLMDKPTSVPAASKSYKIYGKKGSAPAHTRFKGKAYVAKPGTAFRSGQSASVSPVDGKLQVKAVDSDTTQLWEPED